MTTLTPLTMQIAYDFLCCTSPFRDWDLPGSEDVDFVVIQTKAEFGRCKKIKGRYRIEVSSVRHSRTVHWLETLAHEICHIRQDMIEPSTPHHGTLFQELARQVCHQHGFDPCTF